MNSVDLILMGVKNLWRRKLRTFLTVLGVIIGTSSIVVMLSLGFGMQEAFKSQLDTMGSLTTITIYKGYGGYGGSPLEDKKDAKLDDKAVMDFKNMEYVKAVTPVVETQGMIINGRYQAYAQLKGIDPTAMEDFDFKIQDGRLLQPGDGFFLVFGGAMPKNFYDPKAKGQYREIDVDLMMDRMTFTFDTGFGMPTMPGEIVQKPKYKEYRIKTAGILEEGNWETDWGVYAPLDVVQDMIKERERAESQQGSRNRRDREYEQIMIKVDDGSNVKEVRDKIKDKGFEAQSLIDILDEMNKVTGVIQAVLGGIGAISLLVAAIGITNTMVMSIYERTKEIGVMKVIGASLGDIKRLFLFESALIGLLGGVLGIIFSKILSVIVNMLAANFGISMGFDPSVKISIIPIWLIFAAMGFSALIGIISGYYPARRAMNLSALEAIRTE